MTITTRAGKGSALTFEELDENFTFLQGQTTSLSAIVTASLDSDGETAAGVGIQFHVANLGQGNEEDANINLSKFIDADGNAASSASLYPVITSAELGITTASASGSGTLAYSSTNKQFTFTPPDLTSFLTSSSSISSAQLPAIAITSVQTAATEAAMLALTTQEGDVVVRSDETKSYVRNSGTTDPHDMSNFTLLQTPDADTTYGMTISQTGTGDAAVLNNNPILKLDPSTGSDIDITLTGGTNTTVTRVSDTEVSIASTDTTYSISSVVDAGDSDNHTMIRLSAGGSGSGDDDVKIKSGGGITLTTDNDGQVTIAGLSIGTSSTTALAGDTALLQLGTSSTTALAGDTAYVASETDPVVGAITGIVKADGSGTISAATAGTDYNSPDKIGARFRLPSGNNSVSGTHKHIEIATINITAVGESYKASFLINTTDYADNTNITETTHISIRQTDAFGNNPEIYFSTETSRKTGDMGVFCKTRKTSVTSPSNLTQVKLFAVLPATGNVGAEGFVTSETVSDSTNVSATWESSFAETDYLNSSQYGALGGNGDIGDVVFLHSTKSQRWADLFGSTAGITVTDGTDTNPIDVIANGTGFLKNNGSGTYSYDNTTYSTLALGTSSTTALAGDTALLALGTSSTTALAGDTALLALGTTSTTALAGDTALLALGTSSTTALAGDTVVDNRLLEVAKSNTSLNTGDKSFLKVATVTIDARYQYYSAQLAVVGTGASEGVANEKVVAIRVKQQSSLSNAPLVEVTTYNNSNEDYDFGHVVAVNTVNETRVDIYFRADGPNSGAEIYRMAETATATVAWVTGFTADYVTSAPTNFVQGGVHEKWHSGNQAGIFGSLTGLLKANGSGVLSAAVAGTDYSTLALGTSSTTALAGDTALLALGTSSTTALAGDTALLQLGTSSTTALAGDTALLALGTSSTTALAGDTALLALGTSSTTALAGDSTFSTLANSSTATDTITIGASAQSGAIAIGNSTAAQTINIAGGSTGGGTTNTVNIASAGGTGSTKTVNIARMSATGVTTNILMGNTSSSATSNITLTGNTTITNSGSSNTITIGGTTQTGTITLGRSTQTQTINIGTGNVAAGKTKTINIGTTNSSGSTTNINIGPTNTSATRAIDINGNLTVDGTTQFDHMVTFKSDASGGNVYDQIVSFQAKGTSSAWYEAARIATLGSGSAPSRMIIGQDDAALTFFDGFGSKYVYPANGDTGAGTNGVCDLGTYSARFKLGRFSSGTTTSSDRNEKRDIEELTAAELRVAVRCKPLLRKYRRIDAYEEKGEAARIHFGIMAQDLDDAFTAEGLDAHRYAMFMEDTWYEYEGGVVTYPTLEDIPEEHRAGATEHTAMGVRYEQLLAFMIAAL